MRDFSTGDMGAISNGDYDTLLTHLSEQVAACLPDHGDEAHNAAYGALHHTWQADLTVRGRLGAAGRRLNVDTTNQESRS